MKELEKVGERKQIEFYFWIHNILRKYVEVVMDIILIGLIAVAFILIIKTILFLGVSIMEQTNIQFVISEIMFIFILIETVRLLLIYLEFHRVAIDTMVEITIVAVLRELILQGFLHVEPIMLASAALFIIVLGLLLRVGGIRKHREVYSVYRPFSNKSQSGSPRIARDTMSAQSVD